MGIVFVLYVYYVYSYQLNTENKILKVREKCVNVTPNLVHRC